MNSQKVKIDTPTKEGTESYEVNLRLVYAMRCIGKGMTAAEEFSGVMNLPSPPIFRPFEKILNVAAKNVCQLSMDMALEEAVALNDGDPKITAAFDGSWQKRGHTSLNGVISASSPETSKIIDVEILSKAWRCPEKN